MKKSSATTCAVVSLTTMIAAGHAYAGAFALREQSAPGQGTSFAGAAAGGAGLGSMFWNPATITMNPGLQSETVLTIISPYSKITQGAGSSVGYRLGSANSGDIGQDAVLPAGYGSWQVSDRLWIGSTSNTPFGLATKPDLSWAGRAYGSSTKVVSFEVSPTIGYKINDMISVGAGVRIMYMNVRYTTAFPQLGAGANPSNWPVLGIEGDSFGFGFTLGATLTPLVGTEIGLGFRSAVEEGLTGNYTGASALGQVTYARSPSIFPGGPAQAGAAAGALYNHPVKVNVVLPEMVTIGLRQQITPLATLLAGFEWTNWSRDGFPRVQDQVTGTVHGATPYLPLAYKDGWFASIGGEYKINDAWTARAGLAYEKSPIATDTRSTRLPDNDRIWASLGVGYKYNDEISFDVGYSHIFPKSTKIDIVPGNPQYSATLGLLGYGNLVGKVDAQVDVVSLSMKYRWDDPTKTLPVTRAAIVKK